MKKILSCLVPVLLLGLGSEAWSMNQLKSRVKHINSKCKNLPDYSPVVINLEEAKKEFGNGQVKNMPIIVFAALNEILNVKYGPTVIKHIYDTTGKPNARDQLGMTAFHHAAKNNWALIEFFAEDENLDPNEKDSNGFTPLMYALENGNNYAVLMTCTHPNINVENYFKSDTIEATVLKRAKQKNKNTIKAFYAGRELSDARRELKGQFAETQQMFREKFGGLVTEILKRHLE